MVKGFWRGGNPPGRAVLASLADQHSAVLGAVEDAPASPVPQAASSTAPARRALVAARSGRRDGRLGRTKGWSGVMRPSV